MFGRHFKPSLIFASTTRADRPSESHSMSGFLASWTNVRLRWKKFPCSNTLAYLAGTLLANEKLLKAWVRAGCRVIRHPYMCLHKVIGWEAKDKKLLQAEERRSLHLRSAFLCGHCENFLLSAYRIYKDKLTYKDRFIRNKSILNFLCFYKIYLLT